MLAELREESADAAEGTARAAAAAGTDPVAVQWRSHHATTATSIAVDASRARACTCLKTRPRTGLKLVADYYISVGKSGIEKAVEGDLRTPLGRVLHHQRTSSRRSLKDFYGSGALPINYPNPLRHQARQDGQRHLASRHTAQPVRPGAQVDRRLCGAGQPGPRAHHASTVSVRTTPVVIAQSAANGCRPTAWLPAQQIAFEDALNSLAAPPKPVSGDLATRC